MDAIRASNAYVAEEVPVVDSDEYEDPPHQTFFGMFLTFSLLGLVFPPLLLGAAIFLVLGVVTGIMSLFVPPPKVKKQK